VRCVTSAIAARHELPVLHLPGREKIVEAPAPEHLIKSGLPTEAMVASVLVAKYGWNTRSCGRRDNRAKTPALPLQRGSHCRIN
jgi:transposase